MNRRPGGLSCRQVGKALQAFLDDEIDDPERRRQLRAHLDDCRDCGLEAETYRRLIESLGRRPAPLDPAALERLRRFGRQLESDEP